MSSFDNFDFNQAFPVINEDTEFFPLLNQQDEEDMKDTEIPEELPILPLQNTVLYPGVVIPITVGRDKSIKLIKDSYKRNRLIGVVAQKEMNVEDPDFEDLYDIGTAAVIIKVLQMPDGNTTVILQGKQRFKMENLLRSEPYIIAQTTFIKEKKVKAGKEFNALISSVKELALQIIQLSPHIPSEAGLAIRNIESPNFLVNFISSNLNADISLKQEILELTDLKREPPKFWSN